MFTNEKNKNLTLVNQSGISVFVICTVIHRFGYNMSFSDALLIGCFGWVIYGLCVLFYNWLSTIKYDEKSYFKWSLWFVFTPCKKMNTDDMPFKTTRMVIVWIMMFFECLCFAGIVASLLFVVSAFLTPINVLGKVIFIPIGVSVMWFFVMLTKVMSASIYNIKSQNKWNDDSKNTLIAIGAFWVGLPGIVSLILNVVMKIVDVVKGLM